MQCSIMEEARNKSIGKRSKNSILHKMLKRFFAVCCIEPFTHFAKVAVCFRSSAFLMCLFNWALVDDNSVQTSTPTIWHWWTQSIPLSSTKIIWLNSKRSLYCIRLYIQRSRKTGTLLTRFFVQPISFSRHQTDSYDAWIWCFVQSFAETAGKLYVTKSQFIYDEGPIFVWQRAKLSVTTGQLSWPPAVNNAVQLSSVHAVFLTHSPVHCSFGGAIST